MPHSFFQSVMLSLLVLSLVPALPVRAQESTTAPAAADMSPPEMQVCTPLPTGQLTPEELAVLVPEGSPGLVRIKWRTESQDECFGFNIYRASTEGGEFQKINSTIIPGEGSTNIPKEYCYEDRSVVRGETYFYYIEELSTQGVATKLQDTLGPDGKGTRVKVKTVEEERAYLKRKALEAVGESPTDAQTTSTAPTA